MNATRSATITRRRFLTASLAASAVSPARQILAGEKRVKIDRIDVFPVRYPTVGYFKFFAGPYGAVGRAAVIVKITADNGTVGWGQSVPVEKWSYETLEASTVAIRDYYAPELIGHDPTDIAGVHKIMDDAIKPCFTTGMPITRAGIDIALHDLTGKLSGKSLSQLWGLPRGGPLTLSWTVNAPQFLNGDVLAEPLTIKGDQIEVPTGPGLGITVDEAKVAELVRRTQRMTRP